ncbi:hypothetical protein ACFCWY_08495 [Streptomyces sp. NPDC056362]|uniref:hypothetical protein n=1 Tax=unclassified Streptomyces TaxID=2593676 RepID=UPI0035DD4795
MPEFTVTTRLLVERIRAARARDDVQTAARTLEELLYLYTQLGRRQIGTAEEQDNYILPWHFGSVPPLLREIGVALSDLPEPPGRRRPVVPQAEEVVYIAQRVDRDGPDEERQCRRFDVEHRPWENVVIDGRRRPYAVIDTDDGARSTSWHTTLTAAQETAAAANRIRSPH